MTQIDEPYIVITRKDYWKLHNGTMTLQQFLDKYKPTQRDLP